MSRLPIPALFVFPLTAFLLAGSPAHAAPGDNQPGQGDNAHRQRHEQNSRARPPEAPRGQPQQARPSSSLQGPGAPREQQLEHQRQMQQQYRFQEQQQQQQRDRARQSQPGSQNRDWQNPGANGRPDNRQPQTYNNRPNTNAARPEPYRGPQNYRIGQRPPNLDRDRPRQFDARDYRHNYQAEQRYRWRPYQPPRGWYERRWYYGERLPTVFWVRDYWIDDFWMFGLAIPPYGYEWVRYGNDALLVNVYNGDILQVVYGLFY